METKLQSTPDIAPPSFASQNTNFPLHNASIYCHPRYTAIKCEEKIVAPYQDLTLHPIRSFYSFRHTPGHNSFFSEDKSSILHRNIAVKTHNTLTCPTSAIRARTPIYKYINLLNPTGHVTHQQLNIQQL